ncbi:Icc protein [Microbacterium sp. W4I20]|nr:Icc protein [Microbacterium sp. W4I20]
MSAGTGSEYAFGRHRPASHVLIHVSDPHFLAGGVRLADRFDVEANFARTLEAIRTVHPNPSAIVVTGDLADLGEPDAYRRLRQAVEPIAAELGAPVVWVAGNHDERPALRRDLLGLPASAEPVTGVWDLDGLRVIALDTSVPGWHHGDLDAGQLSWLADQLSVPAPHGTLLAMHHPPLPSHVPLFDILELRHQDELAEIIRGTDVRGILAGHLHYSSHGTFAGVPGERLVGDLLHDERRTSGRGGERDGCRTGVPARPRAPRHDHPYGHPGGRRSDGGFLLRGVARADGDALAGGALGGVLP